jgi:hypothetical protein
MKNVLCVDWIDLSQNNKWQALVNTVVHLQVPQNAASFWSSEQWISSQEGICSNNLRRFSKLRSGFSWFRTKNISWLLSVTLLLGKFGIWMFYTNIWLITTTAKFAAPARDGHRCPFTQCIQEPTNEPRNQKRKDRPEIWARFMALNPFSG